MNHETPKSYPQVVHELLANPTATDADSIDQRRVLAEAASEAVRSGAFDVATDMVGAVSESVEQRDAAVSLEAYQLAVRSLIQISMTDRSPEAVKLRREALERVAWIGQRLSLSER